MQTSSVILVISVMWVMSLILAISEMPIISVIWLTLREKCPYLEFSWSPFS